MNEKSAQTAGNSVASKKPRSRKPVRGKAPQRAAKSAPPDTRSASAFAQAADVVAAAAKPAAKTPAKKALPPRAKGAGTTKDKS